MELEDFPSRGIPSEKETEVTETERVENAGKRLTEGSPEGRTSCNPLPEPEESTEEDPAKEERKNGTESSDPPEEDLIDPDQDPFQDGDETVPRVQWLKEVLAIEAKTLQTPSPEQQKERVLALVEDFRLNPKDPDTERVQGLERILSELSDEIPDHEAFVASSFQQYLPAWKALLQNSNRRSSTTVLSWL